MRALSAVLFAWIAVGSAVAEEYEIDKDAGIGKKLAEQASSIAKKEVPDLLLAPATAKFLDETVIVHQIDPLSDLDDMIYNRWRVTGKLDAANAFGTPVRSQWIIVFFAPKGKDPVVAGLYFAGTLRWQHREYADLVEKQKEVRRRNKETAEQIRNEAKRLEQEQEARAKAEKEREAREKEKAARETPEAREVQARNLLDQAKSLLAEKKQAAARKRLQKAVDEYAGTASAEEAKKLLKSLK
jgi:hypothetical protein